MYIATCSKNNQGVYLCKCRWKIISTCKGGGYQYARTEPAHPKSNSRGLYPLHRVIMENMLDRQLEKHEIVHHKDENKQNNYPENLVVLSRAEHTKHHKPLKENIEFICGNCNKSLSLKPHKYRLRLKRSITGKLFCSLSCGTIHQYKDKCLS